MPIGHDSLNHRLLRPECLRAPVPRLLPSPAVRSSVGTRAVRPTPVGATIIGPRAVRTSTVEPTSSPRRRATPASRQAAVIQTASVADARWAWDVAAPVRTPETAHRHRRGRRPKAESLGRDWPCCGGLRATQAKPDQQACGKTVSHKLLAHRLTSTKAEYRRMVPLLP